MSSAKQHSWIKLSIKGFSWPVCRGCGLVKLNNSLTALAIKRPCCED